MDTQEDAGQIKDEFYHGEDDPKRKETLKERHFRLKLYEYCFKILYGNYPLRQYTDITSHHRSHSLDNTTQQNSPKSTQLNGSSLSLEQQNRRFLNELNHQLEKDQQSVQLAKKRREMHKESRQIFDDLLNASNENIEAKKRRTKHQKEGRDSKIVLKENATRKGLLCEKELLATHQNFEDPQPEAPKPKFEFLRKSNFNKLNDVEVKHYYKPKKYQDIHRSTSNLIQQKPTTINPDYSKRFSSVPVVSRRTTSMPKRGNIVEREIEADRQALKEVVARQTAKNPKSLTITEAKTPADTARSSKSWISKKRETDDELEEEGVNFERSWSAWSLKKAELLEWDPDFDYQPVGPQEKKIRQKFYKNALIKESSDIERKRKVALENTMMFAKIRKDQLMKSGNLPRPAPTQKPNNKTTLKLPVDKLKNTKETSPKLTPKIIQEQKEEEPKEEEPKEEEAKTSIFSQIKKALQNVPEKLKEILSFGDNTEKEKPKRSISIAEITSDSKRQPSSKATTRRSSAGDTSNLSKHHHSPKHKISATLDLHKHNLRVDSTLGGVLLTKPKKETKSELKENSVKMPQKIAKLGGQKRRPISWRSSHELDKLNSAKQQATQQSLTINLPKLPQIQVQKSHKNAAQTTSNVHLVPIPKQKEIFDPTGNPYRSAGRKYSPIPAAGWPPARSFNPEVGRCKIVEFIEQNWEYSKPQLTYRVEHFHATQIENSKQRFKYRVCWTSTKTEQEGIVYFNVDVSRIDSFDPIELTYRFQGQRKTHRAKFSPTATPYRKRWLKSLGDGKLLSD